MARLVGPGVPSSRIGTGMLQHYPPAAILLIVDLGLLIRC
jgi:hypothetical protein